MQELIQNLIIWAPGVIFAITLHEWAHGYAAWRFGDPTPKALGRLTLNPLPHIDPVWTIALPIVMLTVSLLTTGHAMVFGGAKPVPVNPRNFKGNFRLAYFSVAAAGPAMNLFLALLCALGYRLADMLPPFFAAPLTNMMLAAIQMNVLLAVFNLLPLPPLDGGRVASALLPPALGVRLAGLEPYGMPILLTLMFTGLLGQILWPPMAALSGFYLDVAGLH